MKEEGEQAQSQLYGTEFFSDRIAPIGHPRRTLGIPSYLWLSPSEAIPFVYLRLLAHQHVAHRVGESAFLFTRFPLTLTLHESVSSL